MGFRPNFSGNLLAIVAALGFAGPAPAQNTPISKLVIYGLDGDYGMSGEGGPPGRLFRFTPATGSYQVIGDTYLAGTTTTVWDWESMAYVPGGPNRGLYGVPCQDQPGVASQKLVRISMLDATCEVVGTANLNNVRGMTVVQIGGLWKIYAVHTEGNQSYLSVINPATGAREGAPKLVCQVLGQANTSMRLFGLARDATGVLLGVSHEGIKSRLWVINPATGLASAPGPAANAPRVEALEVAVGDTVPAFSGLPAATSGWPFNRGVLMGFADDNATLYIFNPATGAGEPLSSIAGNPIAVPWTDVEGLVFLTVTQDPMSAVFTGCD